MADPVAWTVVQRGWIVRTTSGEEIGHVDEMLGDPEADIFDGISVSKGLLKGTEYVPSERVESIREGEIVVRP